MTRTEVCECGHVRGMHSSTSSSNQLEVEKCRACACNRFARAEDAQAAILAGIEVKRAAIAAANARRRAERGLGGTDG